MQVNNAHLVSFSPCDHSKAYAKTIALELAGQLGIGNFDTWNALPFAEGEIKKAYGPNDFVILCAPVYGGRIPTPAVERFKNLKGNGAAAVLVVSYGNRAYEDALLELIDLAKEQGFTPVGGAACIAQHTLAPDCASGRPTPEDLDTAREFADKLAAKLAQTDLDKMPPLTAPGNKPYKDYKNFPLPQTVNDRCFMCGACWSNCPTGAITPDKPAEVDKSKCIACVACVHICPADARIINPAFTKNITQKLAPLCEAKKENEYFGV